MADATRIRRFGRTERAFHWALATAFFVLFVTGAFLYIPSLALMVPRPTAKAIHLYAAVGLGVALVAVIALGDRRALGRTARDLDGFDGDDLRWLAGGPRRVIAGGKAPPQGRFNAGQKLNAAFTLGLTVVLAVSGFLLWYGERNTAYRFAGSVHVHDIATLLISGLVAGHLWFALFNPATRHALEGMTYGDVDRAWAAQHHAKWVAAERARAGADEPDRGPATRA